VRHAERLQELEVLVLHVLRRVRRDAVRGDDPVGVARAGAVEAELDGRVDERGDEARLQVDLQVEHEVEAAPRERAAHVGEGAPAALLVEEDDLVDRGMAAHHRGGAGL
jgi:hypothetical protein